MGLFLNTLFTAFHLRRHSLIDWSCVDLIMGHCDVFISCLDSHSDGTHSLQSIHSWASDAMLNFFKSFPMEKQTPLQNGWLRKLHGLCVGAGLEQNSDGLRPSRNWVWHPWPRCSANFVFWMNYISHCKTFHNVNKNNSWTHNIADGVPLDWQYRPSRIRDVPALQRCHTLHGGPPC